MRFFALVTEDDGAGHGSGYALDYYPEERASYLAEICNHPMHRGWWLLGDFPTDEEAMAAVRRALICRACSCGSSA
jgi:hypothetical protein